LTRVVVKFAIGQNQQQTLAHGHCPAALVAVKQRGIELIE
jgi:hypothetical protein